jgi:hypothetical protein
MSHIPGLSQIHVLSCVIVISSFHMTAVSWLLLWLKICGIATLVIGWGWVAVRLLDFAVRGRSNLAQSILPFELGIVGFSLLYVFAVVVSLFAALGAFAHWTLVLVGSVGVAGIAHLRLPVSKPTWIGCMWVAALTALVTFGTAYTEWNYDAGLYHLQAVSYFHQGALPLGIANIHNRLGFNSCWFPLSALCSGPLFGRDGSFLLSAAAMIVFLGGLISGAIEGYRNSRSVPAGAFAVACLLLFVSSGVLFEWFGLSPSPDVPSALSCCYAFYAFLAFAGCLSRSEAQRESVTEVERHLLALVGSAVLAVTAKVSQAPVLLLVLLLPLGVRRLRSRLKPHWGHALLLGGLTIVAWGVQGTVTSGCLAFPAGVSCLSFLPWAAEPANATSAAEAIRAWAKAPGTPFDQIPGGIGWIPMWRDRMLPFRSFVFTLAWVAVGLHGLGAVAMGWGHWARMRHPAASEAGTARAFLVALLVSLVGLAYWFFGAPDPRFGLGFLIAAPAMTFAFMAGWGGLDGKSSVGRIVTPLVAVAVFFAAFIQCYKLYGEGHAACVWEHKPVPPVRTSVTAGGVKVKIPLEGNQCWDVTPPCAPSAISALSRSRFLGHVMYSHFDLSPATASDAPNVIQGDPAFLVAFGPKTWGRESVTLSGKQHWVRWLQSTTEFSVYNDSERPQQVFVSLQVETFRRPRRIRLLLNGGTLPEIYVVTREFSSGPETVKYSAALQPGRNQLSLKADGPMDPLPGNRYVSLLMSGDVAVDLRH